MTITRNRLKRVVAGLTTTAVVGSLAVFATSSGTVSAAPGPGGATLSVSSGTQSTFFDLELVDPGQQTCPADSITGGAGTAAENFRASAFIVDGSVDPVTLNYTGAGIGLLGAPDGDPSALPLISNTGPVINSLPSLPNGNINASDFDTINFANLTGANLANGVWNIGIACFDGDTPGLPTERFWSTQITVSGFNAGSFTWVLGAQSVPDSPSIGAISVDAIALTANVPFTATPATPAIDSFTATVTPINPAGTALPPIVLPASATDFDLTGLDLGTEYEVSLIATNSLGDSAPATDTFTVAISETIVVEVLDVFEGDDVTVTWTAPAGPTPDSYDVEITGDATASQAGVTALSAAFSGLTLGDYTATVTANYSIPGIAASGSDGFSVNPNALIVQEVSVTRPPGALIITQRCGVFGELPRFEAVDAFPGFPSTLPGRGPSGDRVGTSPDIDLVTPGVQPDPEFDNYPFPNPATYPTECGLDMGTASFVSSGALAGQFYEANGRLNQVTVLDTRDNDDGWVAKGDIEDVFTGSTGDTFEGDYLGWVPVVTSDSDPVGTATYDQVVTAGPQVLPGTVGGLTGNAELASAPGGAGLGIATLDARMLLLIPASADAADYNATLTLTVA